MPRVSRCRTVDWDWDEFLYDGKVQAMSNEELGAWVRVLGAMWKAEEPGRMPAAAVFRIMGGDFPGVISCLESDQGWFTHKRTVRSHQEQTARIESRRVLGRAGASKRWSGHSQPNAEPIPPSSLHPVLPESKSKDSSPTGSVKPSKRSKPHRPDNPVDKEWLETFDEVWWPEYLALGRHCSKAGAREVWARIPHADGQSDFDRLSTAFDQAKNIWRDERRETRHLPHADKWLRDYLKNLALEA